MTVVSRLLVLLLVVFLASSVFSRSIAVCRTDLDPALNQEFQHCPTDQASTLVPRIILASCQITPNQVMLTEGIPQIVTLGCKDNAGADVFCSIDQSTDIYLGHNVYNGNNVTINSIDNSSMPPGIELISNTAFGQSEGYTLEVEAVSGTQAVDCSAPISSTQGGGPVQPGDVYWLSVITDKKTYPLDTQNLPLVRATYTIRLVAGPQNGTMLDYYFKKADGTILSENTVPINPGDFQNGIAQFSVNFPTSNTTPGIYIIGGKLPAAESETFLSNNTANRYITLLFPSQEVNVPELNPVLAIFVALGVLIVIQKPKKR